MIGHRENEAGDRTAGTLLEIACDESGSDGENLTGGNTDVFAHAGVCVSAAAAAGAVREIRDRIRSPASEYKATHLLREKHRSVLEWLPAPGGPLHGRAHVHLTEKAFFVVDRVVDLLLEDPVAAVVLFRAGRRDLGVDGWARFLRAANELLRVRGGEPGASVAGFFGTVDQLRGAHAGTPAARVLGRLAARRDRAEAYRTERPDGPDVRIPVLNPLLPAIVSTAAYWSAGGRRPVRLVHDRQNLLTPERIAWIEETARRGGICLEEVRLVVAREDPRVQLADFLAGIARKVASDELNGCGDPALAVLLRPYVDRASVWGDPRSAVALGLDTANPPLDTDR
ncbi:hypothetical protein AB0L56_11915 [Streptomyces sp. NPDC052079]|uniref:hypothetical protein n=1 Tax=Streptomyces sp. NPDC052079 TaxID=3155526 RepID=UPI00343163BF